MKSDIRQFMTNVFTGTDSLTKRLTIAEAEAAFSVVLEEFGPAPIPFGALHPQWQRFKAKMRPGDELWEFLSMFPRGDGLRGVKLLRNGKVIDSIGAFWVDAPQSAAPNKETGASRKAPSKGKRPAPKAERSAPKKRITTARRRPSR